jgi:Raf kinase inhibitor-like YbhB/YbcL family protein
MTSYSVIASALPASASSANQNIFFADDVACLETGDSYIPGALKSGVFVSLKNKIRDLRAKISHIAKNQGSDLQPLRQEYKALKLRAAMYSEICAAGPSQIQAFAKVTKMSISSQAFANNRVIPDAHSCWVSGVEDPGEGQSPPLVWKNVPAKASRLALLVHDKDADFIHWFMLIDKKSSWFKKGLPQNVPDEEVQDVKNSAQNENDFGIKGYSGPCPPAGEKHRYTFELIALNAGAKGVAFDDTASAIKKKLKKNTIISATLTGFYTGKVDSPPPPEQGQPAVPTPLPTQVPAPTASLTPTPAATPTPVPVATNTPTPSATLTSTPTRTPTPTATPTSTPNLLSAVTQVAAGGYHTCTLLNTGAVKCWGINWGGQIGDGTDTDRSFPTALTTLTSGVTQIAAGDSHTCGLLSTGGVKCWGYNGRGQIGDGTTTNRLIPTALTTLTSGVTQIAAGNDHTCALLSTGGVKCWGYNWSGQIGDGTDRISNRSTPTALSTLTSGVTQIAAGCNHTCALLSTGAVKCWGDNLSGQLGDGTTTNRLIPTAISTLTSGVTQIAAGCIHTCALLSTGGVKCWGYNGFGEIGDGTTTNRLIPTALTTLTSGVTQITEGGGDHTCALLSTGGVKCWGRNDSGQIGDGTSTSRTTPTALTALTSGVTQISAGAFHTCARLSTGGVKCWGSNSFGQIGDGTSGTNRKTPVTVLGGN